MLAVHTQYSHSDPTASHTHRSPICQHGSSTNPDPRLHYSPTGPDWGLTDNMHTTPCTPCMGKIEVPSYPCSWHLAGRLCLAILLQLPALIPSLTPVLQYLVFGHALFPPHGYCLKDLYLLQSLTLRLKSLPQVTPKARGFYAPSLTPVSGTKFHSHTYRSDW